jgi:hypothetical protein
MNIVVVKISEELVNIWCCLHYSKLNFVFFLSFVFYYRVALDICRMNSYRTVRYLIIILYKCPLSLCKQSKKLVLSCFSYNLKHQHTHAGTCGLQILIAVTRAILLNYKLSVARKIKEKQTKINLNPK